MKSASGNFFVLDPCTLAVLVFGRNQGGDEKTKPNRREVIRMGWMSLLAAFMLRFTGASLSVEVRKGRFL
jgi:hypothetical protein